MEGSRSTPNVPEDIFQDYGIVYVVTGTKSFRENKDWINCLGIRLYMQYPEESVYSTAYVDSCYGQIPFIKTPYFRYIMSALSSSAANVSCILCLIEDNPRGADPSGLIRDVYQ